MLDDVPAPYWLTTCNGLNAVQAFVNARQEQVPEVLDAYPILLLPEFPHAIVVLAGMQVRQDEVDVLLSHANYLRQLHAKLLTMSRSGYGEALERCARVLRRTQDGDTHRNLSRARALIREAREFFEPDSPAYAQSFVEEAHVSRAQTTRGSDPRGDLLRVIEELQTARRYFKGGSEESACALLDEAAAHRALARMHAGSQAHLTQAVACDRQAQALLPERHERFAEALMGEGLTCHQLAELGIEPEHNAALAIQRAQEARQHLPAESSGVVATLFNEAQARVQHMVFGSDVQFDQREVHRLLYEARQHVPTDSLSTIHAAIIEADMRVQLGELGIDAADNLRHAVVTYQEQRQHLAHQPRADQDIEDTLFGEGRARCLMAEIGFDVLENLREAARLFAALEERYPPRSLHRVQAQSNRASTHFRLGMMGVERATNLTLAGILFARSRDASPIDSFERGKMLIMLAQVHLHLAQGATERKHLQLAQKHLAAARTRFPHTGFEFGRFLFTEGTLHLRLGISGLDRQQQFTRALELFQEAREHLPVDGFSYANALHNEGLLRSALARTEPDQAYQREPAARLLGEAAAHLRALGHGRGAITSYAALAELYRSARAWPDVCSALEQALACVEEVRQTAPLLADRRAWMERNMTLYKRMVDACLRIGRYEEAFNYVERGRSRALLDLLAAEDLAPRHAPDDETEKYRWLRRRAQALEVELGTDENPLPGPGVRAAPGTRRHVLLGERRSVVEQLSAVEDRLRQADPDFIALAQPLQRDDLRALATRLGRPLSILWNGEDRGLLFTIFPNGEMAFTMLPDAGDSDIRRWLYGSGRGGADSGWMGAFARLDDDSSDQSRLEAQIDRTLSAVYEAVMQPLHRLLTERGERSGAIILGGPLGLLPLHAAFAREGNHRRYVLDDIDLVYAPSAWVLGRCLDRDRDAWTPVLGIGNPSVGLDAGLPFASWEISQLGMQVELHAAGGFRQVSGLAATLPTVLALLPDYAVVHFACHAEWDRHDPLRSRLLLAGADELTLGRLLATTRLERSQLVVLSACESARSFDPRSTGEEFLGLPAGFLVAGARAVVGSLWPVPDLPSALLMDRFYQFLLAGQPISEALRRAQCWLRDLPVADAVAQLTALGQTAQDAGLTPDTIEQHIAWIISAGERPFSHPFYWGAFSVVGAPHPIV